MLTRTPTKTLSKATAGPRFAVTYTSGGHPAVRAICRNRAWANALPSPVADAAALAVIFGVVEVQTVAADGTFGETRAQIALR